jgi:hypothetical protein
MSQDGKPQHQLGFGYEPERLLFIYASFKNEIKDRPIELSNVPHILSRAVRALACLGHQYGWTTGFEDVLLERSGRVGKKHEGSFSDSLSVFPVTPRSRSQTDELLMGV